MKLIKEDRTEEQNQPEEYQCWALVDDAEENVIARFPDGTTKKDASLFLAAPELLEGLENLVAVISAGISVESIANTHGGSLDMARTAIAKAKGAE